MSILDVLARSPLRRLTGRDTAILHYTAPRSGQQIQLPVWAVPSGDGWIVAVGQADKKTWWRAFRRPLQARLDAGGRLHAVTGHLLTGADRESALAAYRKSVPMSRAFTSADTPMVVLRRPA